MIEEWRIVPEWPTYAVSNFGNVKRVEKSARGCRYGSQIGNVLPHTLTKGGHYPVVVLSSGHTSGKKRRKQWFVHRLVMHCFVGPCPSGQEVNHIDGNKLNYRLDNLEYVTRSENIKHAFKTGLLSRVGTKNSKSILTDEIVASILTEYTGKWGQCTEFAKRYGVSHAAVQDILHRRNWTHVSIPQKPDASAL